MSAPATPDYLALERRLIDRGLTAWDAVTWTHRAIAARDPKARGLADLSPEHCQDVWAAAGEAAPTETQGGTDDAIPWPAD